MILHLHQNPGAIIDYNPATKIMRVLEGRVSGMVDGEIRSANPGESLTWGGLVKPWESMWNKGFPPLYLSFEFVMVDLDECSGS